jgi:two-component system, OmpR family, sensor histidine kinase QseC
MAILTFTLVVYLTINRMVRPLRRASDAAARIGPQNLATRLGTEGLPTELTPLIGSFNAALERLEVGFRVQQEFLASAAHELKTPLALLQAEIELGGAANTSYLLRDTALMARIVHQLLHLAEVSEGHNFTFEPISLQAEVQEAIEYLNRLADKHSVRVQLETENEDTNVIADRGAVFVLVKNLLENAIHHSPAGGVVRVLVDTRGFSVQDQGPGVATGDEPHLFQRFWRAEVEDSDGAGLGLTICKEICRAHRWHIQYEAAPGGVGARFVVTTDP